MRITKIALAFIMIVMCSALFVGCGDSEIKIEEMKISDSTQIDMLVGEVTSNIDMRITGTKEWQTSDINVVIGDDSIVRVEYKKSIKSSMFVSFKITALKAGSTSICFETADKSVRSNVITVTVSEPSISVEFTDSDEVTLRGLGAVTDLDFSITKNGEPVSPPADLEAISGSPDVVTVALNSVDGEIVCSVTPVSEGEAFIYIQSTEMDIRSEKIKITVTAATDPSDPVSPEEEEQTPDAPNVGDENQGGADDNQNQDNTDGGDESQAYVLNTSSHKIHHPDCYTIKNMKTENREDVYGPIEEYLEDGYEKCKTCFK